MVKFVTKMEKIRLEPMESVDSQDSRIEIDDDDDFSDDDDDDVFIRNGGTKNGNGKPKNGVIGKGAANNRKEGANSDENGGEASRPLMRRKKKVLPGIAPETLIKPNIFRHVTHLALEQHNI